MEIRVIDDGNKFFQIKEDWEKLTQNKSTYNSFDWIYDWWLNYKDECKLSVLLAIKESKVIGIAPLCIKNTKALKFIPFKTLTFLGKDLAEYNDFFIDENESKSLIYNEFFDFIKNNLNYDVAEFNYINSTFSNYNLWQYFSDNFSGEVLPYKECRNTALSLFNDYEDYSKNCLSKKHRREIRYRALKAQEDNIVLDFEFKNNVKLTDLEKFAEINIKRQQFLRSKGFANRDSYYSDSKVHSFIKKYFCEQNRENLFLATIKSKTEVIGYFLGFTMNKKIYLWNTAFDVSFERYSPSKLLINEIIKYAYENGYEYIDFMRGNESYKLHWANDISQDYNIIQKRSFLAKAVYLYRDLAPDFLIATFRKPDIKMLENEM